MREGHPPPQSGYPSHRHGRSRAPFGLRRRSHRRSVPTSSSTSQKDERERLKTELMVAQCWVRELASWVEENAPPVGAVARERSRLGEKPLGSFGLPFASTPSVRPLDRRAATTALAVLFAPWLVLGLVIYIAYALP